VIFLIFQDYLIDSQLFCFLVVFVFVGERLNMYVKKVYIDFEEILELLTA
jgi:hypothetical protein